MDTWLLWIEFLWMSGKDLSFVSLFHDLCGFCWYTRNLMYILDTLLYLLFSPYPVTEREASCQSQISLAQLLFLKFFLVVLRHARLVRRTSTETRASRSSLDEESREVARILFKTFFPHKKTLWGKRLSPEIVPLYCHFPATDWGTLLENPSLIHSFCHLYYPYGVWNYKSLTHHENRKQNSIFWSFMEEFRHYIFHDYGWVCVLSNPFFVPFMTNETLEFQKASSRETIEVMF